LFHISLSDFCNYLNFVGSGSVPSLLAVGGKSEAGIGTKWCFGYQGSLDAEVGFQIEAMALYILIQVATLTGWCK